MIYFFIIISIFYILYLLNLKKEHFNSEDLIESNTTLQLNSLDSVVLDLKNKMDNFDKKLNNNTKNIEKNTKDINYLNEETKDIIKSFNTTEEL